MHIKLVGVFLPVPEYARFSDQTNISLFCVFLLSLCLFKQVPSSY